MPSAKKKTATRKPVSGSSRARRPAGVETQYLVVESDHDGEIGAWFVDSKVWNWITGKTRIVPPAVIKGRMEEEGEAREEAVDFLTAEEAPEYHAQDSKYAPLGGKFYGGEEEARVSALKRRIMIGGVQYFNTSSGM